MNGRFQGFRIEKGRTGKLPDSAPLLDGPPLLARFLAPFFSHIALRLKPGEPRFACIPVKFTARVLRN